MFFSSSKPEAPAAQEVPLTPEPSAAAGSPPAENPLLQNLERTVFTFNMHNLTEMCFEHVVKRSLL